MLNRLPLLGFISRVGAASALIAMPACAQAPHPLTSADRQRVDEIVHKMTLAEKLDYIGGMEMTIRAVPSVNVRALQMSDGPIGVRLDTGFPSTTYAGGIALAASWDRAPCTSDRARAAAARATFTSRSATSPDS